MSLQVGNFCFATPAAAGVAACSQYVTVSTITQPFFGNPTLVATSCSGSDPNTGALLLNVASTDLILGTQSNLQISTLPTFPPCNQLDYVLAGEAIFGALLALYITWYTGKKLIATLNWSRGDYV